MKLSYFSPKIGGVRVCNGPLLEHIESCLEQERTLGYKPVSVAVHLRLISQLNQWLVRTHRTLKGLNEAVIERFLKQVRKGRRYTTGEPTTLGRLLDLLRDAGVIASAERPDRSPSQSMADEYRSFLARERGLDSGTIYNYARHIDRFLSERFGADRVRLSQLTAREVIEFVKRDAHSLSRGHALQVVTAVRSFLRFARYRGYTKADLEVVVPRVANWKLAGLPKYLPRGAVRRVLDCCDRATVTGRRDYAIFMLLARLGLRAGEIVALRLEDIDWENAEITVRSKKGCGWARLPLPADVGEAIACYLENGRPHCRCRNVFVRILAPHTPFANSGVVSCIVMTALSEAGVESARKGAHTFRHTLATDMLRNGASLDEIGQVLRHKDPDTTAIYAKVEIDALRQLALPWTGGVR